MRNKILTINTTNPEKTAILLAEYLTTSYLQPRRLVAKKVWQAETYQSEELLIEIDKLLKKNRVLPKNLGLIIVNIGPGSFTGIRVGVATANTLAFGLEIPVVGVKGGEEGIEQIAKVGLNLYQKKKIKKSQIARPFYNKAPNITKSKKM